MYNKNSIIQTHTTITHLFIKIYYNKMIAFAYNVLLKINNL